MLRLIFEAEQLDKSDTVQRAQTETIALNKVEAHAELDKFLSQLKLPEYP